MYLRIVIYAVALLITIIAPLANAQSKSDTWTTSKQDNYKGIDYELLIQNNKGNVSMKPTGSNTSREGGTFEAKWSGTDGLLVCAGNKWDANSSKKISSLRNVSLEFEATLTSNDAGKWLGICGYIDNPKKKVPTKPDLGQGGPIPIFNHKIEYFIIQDRSESNPATAGTNPRKYGEGTIDGIVYEFWVCDKIIHTFAVRNNNFRQCFSIPKNTTSHRQSGTVSISSHFEAWEKAGIPIMECNLYEISLKVESNSRASDGKGEIQVKKNLLTIRRSGSVK